MEKVQENKLLQNFPGYEFSATTGQCEDIDECTKSGHSTCGIDSECQNSFGSYRCVCKPGFRLRDDSRSRSSVSTACIDINECDTIPGICQQRCANLWGSYRCLCKPGTGNPLQLASNTHLHRLLLLIDFSQELLTFPLHEYM